MRVTVFALLIGLLPMVSPTAAQVPRSDQTTHGAWFEPEPCPFWSVEESARFHVECGKLVVPESETSGRRYRLQVAILRSHRERLYNDATVLVPGGPGDDLIGGNAARLAQHPLQDAERQHRDIVLLDPRGTGYSEPGELCPGFEGMEVRAAILRLPLDDRIARIRRELAACRTRLQAEGIDPGQFNSVALAGDLEWLRKALGYDSLNLIGLSWGTRVVLETMRRFPAAVRSAVLYGPLPPDGWGPGTTAERVGPSLARLFAECAAEARCRTEFPSIEEEFRAMLAALDADPVRLDTRWGPFLVDGSVAETVVSHALYDSDFIPYVPLAIRELRRRNATFVEVFLQGAMGQGSSGGFYYAARCFELPPPLAADSREGLGERYPWLGRSDRFAPEPAAVCDAFVAPSADLTTVEPVRSDVPTVIFAGQFDPATPPEFGRRVAATLPNSHLLVIPGKGHDVNVPIPCTVQIRRMLLDNPGQPPDTSCLAELPPISFAADVYVNAGVARLVARLVSREPLWLAGIGLLLVSLAAGVVLLPVSRVARRSGKEPRRAALVTSVLWAAAAVSLVFSAGVTAALWAAGDPYLPLFGVQHAWRWLFVLPWIVVLLTAAGAVGVLLGWRGGWWARWRVLHAMTAAASVAFVLVVVWTGML